MKTVGIFEAKTKLSEICSTVSETGEKIVITRRGVPLVQLTPLQTKQKSLIERLDDFNKRWPPDPNEPDFDYPPREPAPDMNIFADEPE